VFWKVWKVWKIWYFLRACVSGPAAGPAGSGSYIPSPRGRGGRGVRPKRSLRSFANYVNGNPTRRHRRLKAPQARPFGPRSLSLQAKPRQSLRVLGCRSARGHPTG